jgi:teichuronic acid biosynthesis glycosyltransferase TuaG
MDFGLVSVVIPVYNGEKYIEKCLISVVNQDYTNLEIVIVNDGSTDKTEDKIFNFKSDLIHYLKLENSGCAAARNKGINLARGKYIAFLDSDDIWSPNKLSYQLSRCSNEAMSFTNSYFLGGEYSSDTTTTDLTDVYSGSIFDKLIINNFIGTSDVIVKREVIRSVGSFNEDMKALEDWECWLKIAKNHDIYYCDKVLSYYRVHSDSLSRSARKVLKYHIELIDSIYKKGGLAESFNHLKNKSLSRSYGVNSVISEQEGDYLFSAYCALKASLYNFRSIRNALRPIKLLLVFLLKSIVFSRYEKN